MTIPELSSVRPHGTGCSPIFSRIRLCTEFDMGFDFILAQSIITHSGARNTERLFESASRAINPDGIVLLSYIKGGKSAAPPEADWTCPENVRYPEAWLKETAGRHGLAWREIAWHHPGAIWAALARGSRLKRDVVEAGHGHDKADHDHADHRSNKKDRQRLGQ